MTTITLANLTDTLAPSTVATVTTTTPFSATLPGRYWINRATGAALSFSLLSAPALDQAVLVKDIKGDAASWAITISDPNGLLIDGQSQLVLDTNYASALLVWNGSGWSQVA